MSVCGVVDSSWFGFLTFMMQIRSLLVFPHFFPFFHHFSWTSGFFNASCFSGLASVIADCCPSFHCTGVASFTPTGGGFLIRPCQLLFTLIPPPLGVASALPSGGVSSACHFSSLSSALLRFFLLSFLKIPLCLRSLQGFWTWFMYSLMFS